MNTIKQQITEAHKNYLSKQNLVQSQLDSIETELDKYNHYRSKSEFDSIMNSIDPLFNIDGMTYSFDYSKFSYTNSNAYSVNLANMTKEEGIDLVNKYYDSEELVQSLIEKNQDGINKVLSDVDNKNNLRRMYNEMGDTNTMVFQDRLKTLMSTENEYIELPSRRSFDEYKDNCYVANWKPERKWVKYRFDGDKTREEAYLIGYTIKGKVKKNYLMDINDHYDGLIEDVLVTPKEFDYMVNHVEYTLHKIDKLEDGISGYELRMMAGELDAGYYETEKITSDINKLMGKYSTFSVSFQSVPNQEYWVQEWNAEKQDWIHIKTFLVEDYIETKKVA